MRLADYANFSNYAVASATVVLALSWLAYLAEWGFARQVEPSKELVGAGAPVQGELPERSEVAGSIGTSLASLAMVVLLAAVVARGLAAERVPWGNMYEFACMAILVALVVYLVLVRAWGISWLGPSASRPRPSASVTFGGSLPRLRWIRFLSACMPSPSRSGRLPP